LDSTHARDHGLVVVRDAGADDLMLVARLVATGRFLDEFSRILLGEHADLDELVQCFAVLEDEIELSMHHPCSPPLLRLLCRPSAASNMGDCGAPEAFSRSTPA